MKLKKIRLKNIRSYKDQIIEFPAGSTLLSGDIGSGKTSILLGIEFGLFGLQPGTRGNSILRNGEEEGGVIIEFEIEGRTILIERTLKRKKTITQDYCAISIDGQREEISVSELKSRVLDLLRYPKEFAKKQNLLYKFTVYTPQEEMKQIILQDSETRLNTIRHVFGIDKYKTILENASTIASKLREKQRIKKATLIHFEQDKINVSAKEEELKLKYDNLIIFEKDLLEKIEERKKLEEEQKEIGYKIEERKHFEQELSKAKLMISTKKDSISSNLKLIDQLNLQIEELNKLRFDENEIVNFENKIQELKREKENLNEKNLELTTIIYTLNHKNKESDSIKEKLTHIEVCPTCLQDVNSDYKANVVNKLNSSIKSNDEKIEQYNLEKRKILDKMMKIDEEILSIEKGVHELKILKIKLEGILEKESRIEEIKRSNDFLKKDVELFMQQIEVLNKDILKLSSYQNSFEKKQLEINSAVRAERVADIKVAELKKEIEVFSNNIKELKEKIKIAEEIQARLNYLTEIESWLSKNFIPAISRIEKNVIVKLKLEFSKLFSQWFNMLVSDSFNVRLSDDFTPIIERQDCEFDYEYLSGGERTAIALAYRLALNQVINSLMSKIKTRNLVILDEPTDGFSDQQLNKMRDVLEQLNIEQLIIVSHEQKMEDFVENIIKFKKDDGISLKE